MSDCAAVDALAAEVLEKHGRVDVLVNNAAVVDPEGQSAISGDPNSYDKVMEHIHVPSGALIAPCHLRTFPQII